MENLGADVFHAWEYVYFSEWEKNLTEVPGANWFLYKEDKYFIQVNNRTVLLTLVTSWSNRSYWGRNNYICLVKNFL